MTVKELIDKIREEKPNSFSNDKLVGFLNEIEAEVAEQIDADFTKYQYERDKNKHLMAKAPYDRLYVSYLKAMIDLANEELESYVNFLNQHNADFQDFVDWAVRVGIVKTSHRVTRLRNTF